MSSFNKLIFSKNTSPKYTNNKLTKTHPIISNFSSHSTRIKKDSSSVKRMKIFLQSKISTENFANLLSYQSKRETEIEENRSGGNWQSWPLG